MGERSHVSRYASPTLKGITTIAARALTECIIKSNQWLLAKDNPSYFRSYKLITDRLALSLNSLDSSIHSQVTSQLTVIQRYIASICKIPGSLSRGKNCVSLVCSETLPTSLSFTRGCRSENCK